MEPAQPIGLGGCKIQERPRGGEGEAQARQHQLVAWPGGKDDERSAATGWSERQARAPPRTCRLGRTSQRPRARRTRTSRRPGNNFTNKFLGGHNLFILTSFLDINQFLIEIVRFFLLRLLQMKTFFIHGRWYTMALNWCIVLMNRQFEPQSWLLLSFLLSLMLFSYSW